MESKMQCAIAEAKRLLYAYPERTQKEKIKYQIKRIVRPSVAPKHNLFSWPQAMLTLGLLEAGEREYVEDFYQKYMEKGCPIENMDSCMHGQVLLVLFDTCSNPEKKAQYQKTLEKMYQYLLGQYEKYNCTIPYREHHTSYILVDGIGMVVPFLAKYGSVFQENKATEMATKLLNDYWECGMDAISGLPYHGYDSQSGMKYGIIGWGRAVGWLLMGIVESLEYMPEKTQKMWQVRAFQLVDKCMTYQRPDGGFSWQPQAVEGHIDSSTMAMFGMELSNLLDRYSFDEAKTVDADIEKQRYEELQERLPRLISALECCVKAGKVLDASAECIDFAQYPQIYGSYPWSVGPYLRMLASIGQ